MLHAQSKLLEGMISGVQVEGGNTLRLYFEEAESMNRFLKMNLRYKLVLQDPQTKSWIKESPFVFFTDCKPDQQGMCLCFPYELDAVPNLLALSKPGSEKISTYIPHVFSMDLPSDEEETEYVETQLSDEEELEESSRILGAFAEISQPPARQVIERGHLRLAFSRGVVLNGEEEK